MPHIPKVHGGVPDVLPMDGNQRISVYTSAWVCKAIGNHYIPRTSQQAQLDIAHTPHNVVNILGYEQNRCLIVHVLELALVGKGHQQSPGTAGWIVDGYPPSLLDFLRQIFAAGHFRRHFAHIVRCEKLTIVVVTEFQSHK